MTKAARSLVLASLALVTLEAAAEGPRFARNSAPGGGNHVRLASQPVNGVGLAPTTWGFVAQYSGTLYGSGYYPFRVDLTYAGTNSIYGYTFNYPTFGFINEIRAIYAFDVASLDGQTPPVWSAFMFDTRERPPAGGVGLSVFAELALVTSGNTHHLQGLSLFQGNGATNLDVYDAEDFENAAPFDNPELAFIGTGNTLITTVPVVANAGGSRGTGPIIVPLDIDVTNAVLNDLGLLGGGPPVVEVPALDSWGLAALALLLAGVGALLLRR